MWCKLAFRLKVLVVIYENKMEKMKFFMQIKNGQGEGFYANRKSKKKTCYEK